jgi:alpha-glucosidase
MFELIAAAAAAHIAVSSPDGSLEIRIAPDASGYTVSRKQEEIVSTSALGLQMAGASDFKDLQLVKVKKKDHNKTYRLTATKSATAKDHYRSQVLTFREASGERRELSIEVRAYDNGVAWRYRTPAGQAVTLMDEKTSFRLAGDPTCIVSEYKTSHEDYWNPIKVSQLDPSKLYDYPVVCASPSGHTHYAVVQSDLSGYAGSALKPGSDGLQVDLFRRPDRKDVSVISENGLKSGWRVIMTADRAGDLIESPLIGNLAPQAKGDFTWVKPGKAAWDWWSGPTAGDKPTMERFKRFIDFAAESGFPYFLIDAGWPLNATPCCDADPKTDITRPDPAIDMPALVDYAGKKGVGLMLWAHWKHVEPRMDEVLDTYQRWGIKGIKVDFMERDDQEMVRFYGRLAAATAKRHLLLDMHGAFPPMGLSRTYPNYITQEGVMGAEYNKFDWAQITPSHNVKLAYTRMLLGPMDYTPGGFRNNYPEAYVQSEIMPSTRYTRGQALAQFVVYESPLQMVSDDPVAYKDASGFDFVKEVPTAWDETKFVDGTPDSHVIVARRSGDRWYVGAMNNEQARTVDIPLNFLAPGQYDAVLWQDGATANDVERTTLTASDSDKLKVVMARGGGAAIVLTKRGAAR